jgi:hypothetical protein
MVSLGSEKVKLMNRFFYFSNEVFMSACASQTFPGVSATKWACLKASISANGYPITTDQGSTTDKGFTIAWNYNSAAQTLTIQCTDSPWYAPCSAINAKIHDLFDQSGCN